MNGDETAKDCGGSCPACPIACQWNDHCPPGDVCYPDVCVRTVNGCSIGSAVDLTNMAAVTVQFGGAHGESYVPRCIVVTMYTQITFEGDFTVHPLTGGHVEASSEHPASSGPFVPATTTGSTKTVTMDACATFPYYCDDHALSGMNGAVFVVPP
jgi:plastocyanin